MHAAQAAGLLHQAGLAALGAERADSGRVPATAAAFARATAVGGARKPVSIMCRSMISPIAATSEGT